MGLQSTIHGLVPVELESRRDLSTGSDQVGQSDKPQQTELLLFPLPAKPNGRASFWLQR